MSFETATSSAFAPAPLRLAPGATIGILGGGQLGRMLAMAAGRLGFDVVVLTPEPDSPASRVAAHTVQAAYDDAGALAELACACAVATFEFENVPAEVVAALHGLGVPTAPSDLALATAQDRVIEKTFFRDQGIATVDFTAVDTVNDIVAGLARLGAPALLKTRRDGYDGKGQAWVATPEEAHAAFDRLGGVPMILEARAPFVRELSIIAVRARDGTVAAYPLTENTHRGGVLHLSVAPAKAKASTHEAAISLARTTLERLDYVGVAGIELFELSNGDLLVNEFAPRVHNSGHWTLDACEVDQFEQHIRAVAGWPLGPTQPFAHARMENLLGGDVDDWAKLAAEPDARLWLYGKRETVAGRKMGHVTRLSPLA
jgi:5-(carboxyamino)imidazole ribonucleotide synthase